MFLTMIFNILFYKNKMHFWYDTREGERKLITKYPIEGWIFPCFVCSSPTSRYITINNKIHRNEIYDADIDIQCCSSLCRKNIIFSKTCAFYLVKYSVDKRSNR